MMARPPVRPHALRRSAPALALALLLAGCGSAGRLRPEPLPAVPEIPIPDAYSGSPVGHDEGDTPSGPGSAPWWHAFGSAELDALIDRGLANNPDMRIAVQHIVQARARLEQARAARLPTLGAPLLLAEQSAGSASVGSAPPGGAASPGGSQRTLQAGVRADWRLDLWGEQGALAESARFQLLRAIHERENVERNLCAAIAGSYIDYLSLNDRRRIAEQTDAVQSATLATIESRVKAGDATVADLEQQRAVIFSVRATLPVLEQSRVDSMATLAFLTGTVPGRLRLSDLGLDSLRAPVTVAGLPSRLLLRRPDVRMAEAALRAARADVGVARARLLPPMDLAAQLGRSAVSPAQLLLPQTLFWSLVDTVSVNLFDGGRRQQDETIARAVAEEMVESYVRAIQLAIKEVESALATVRLSDERLAAEQATLESARRASEIAARIYRIGGVDYLTLLDTQRSYHHYLDNYAQARVGQFRAHVALLSALGTADAPLDPPAAGNPATPAAAEVAARISQRCLIGLPGDDGRPERSGDWQVVLAGTYHCATVAPAWRDLLGRYPNTMQERVLRPTLLGRIDTSPDSEESWFRLAISRFATRDQAQAFCAALQADQLRCEVGATPAARPLGGGTPAPAAAPRPATGLVLSALDGEVPEVPALPPGASAAPAPGRPRRAGEADPEAVAPALPERLEANPQATTETPRPAAAPGVAVRAGGGARYLQLGAFRDAANAEALRARVSEALRGNAPALQLRREGGLTLLWAGPFSDAQGERSAAARLREAVGGEPRSVRGPLASSAGGS